MEQQRETNEMENLENNNDDSKVLEFSEQEKTSQTKLYMVNEDPFEALKGNMNRKSTKPAWKKLKSKNSTLDDSALLKPLKSNEEADRIEKKHRIDDIVYEMTFYTTKPITVPEKKYYKFPYKSLLVNDGTLVCRELMGYYPLALKSLFYNYRNHRLFFRFRMSEGLIWFETEIKCSFGIERFLIENDIRYNKGEELITIDPKDRNILYDAIVNIGTPKGKPMPFILSNGEFEGGIVHYTKLVNAPPVTVDGKVEMCFRVVGPLYTGDYDNIIGCKRIDYKRIQ